MNIPLNISLQQICLHLFNFAILAGGLYFLLYKPVKAFMEKRTTHYADMEAQAAETRQSAEALRAEYEQKLDAARAEADEIKAQAARDAEKLTADAVAEAEARKGHILQQAREDALRERDDILQGAREEIVDLAVAAAAKIARGERVTHE